MSKYWEKFRDAAAAYLLEPDYKHLINPQDTQEGWGDLWENVLRKMTRQELFDTASGNTSYMEKNRLMILGTTMRRAMAKTSPHPSQIREAGPPPPKLAPSKYMEILRTELGREGAPATAQPSHPPPSQPPLWRSDGSHSRSGHSPRTFLSIAEKESEERDILGEPPERKYPFLMREPIAIDKDMTRQLGGSYVNYKRSKSKFNQKTKKSKKSRKSTRRKKSTRRRSTIKRKSSKRLSRRRH